jgi:hypothetical protein
MKELLGLELGILSFLRNITKKRFICSNFNIIFNKHNLTSNTFPIFVKYSNFVALTIEKLHYQRFFMKN